MIFFTKMQGTGNDFVVINILEQNIIYTYQKLAEYLCNRKFGIGADGVIFIESSKVADVKMRIFNSDGTEAEMCGNGIRCLGKYLYEKNICSKKEIEIETLAGVKKLELNVEGKTVIEIEVDMGEPMFEDSKIPIKFPEEELLKLEIIIENEKYEIYPISMGNPHAVCFVDDVENIDIEKIGRTIENYMYFPNKTNVEFVEIKDKNNLKVRVWERGVGETLGCGTGACAVGVISYLKLSTNSEVIVDLPGGKLKIIYIPNENNVKLIGDSKEVFEGKLNF